METHGREITGYSSEDATDFGPDKVPLSLFDLPTVPGPDSPPGDRLDLSLDFDKQTSGLAPEGLGIKTLLSRYTSHDLVKVSPDQLLPPARHSLNPSVAYATHSRGGMLSAVQGWGSGFLGWFSSGSAKASEGQSASFDAEEREENQSKTKGD